MIDRYQDVISKKNPKFKSDNEFHVIDDVISNQILTIKFWLEKRWKLSNISDLCARKFEEEEQQLTLKWRLPVLVFYLCALVV